MSWRVHAPAPPRVWAHRGDSAHVTENTLAAFESARAKQADGVELDVRLDADGTVVVFHDDDLRRLAGRAEPIERLAGYQRRAVRVLGGHPIPTLAEALAACGPLRVNVEIKSRTPGRVAPLARAVCELLAAMPDLARIVVSSFDPVALWHVRRRLPTVATAALFHAAQPAVWRRGGWGRWLGATCVHPEASLVDAATVARWHQAGQAIAVWTVDDPAELRRLAGLGVDGVFTNDPARAREVLSATA